MADEAALLTGGPADGVRVSVAGRPKVLQVVRPCEPVGAEDGVRVQALYVYRRHDDNGGLPLLYSFDPASP